MTSDFYADVEARVGPLLEKLGFVLDELDDSPDEGGIERNIVYYRSRDSIADLRFRSRRRHNETIAPFDAREVHIRLDGRKEWHYTARFQ